MHSTLGVQKKKKIKSDVGRMDGFRVEVIKLKNKTFSLVSVKLETSCGTTEVLRRATLMSTVFPNDSEPLECTTLQKVWRRAQFAQLCPL